MSSFNASYPVIMALVVVRDASPCHNWVPIPIGLDLLIKNAVQDRFLGEAVDVSWGLWLLRQCDTCRANGAIVQTRLIVHLMQ
jgi:hypothetical protein